MSSPDAAPLPRAGEVFFDVRGSSRCMRLSWYADTGVAVFSIWQGAQCTGTFRLPLAELPRMAEALRSGPAAEAGAAPPGTGHWDAPVPALPQAQRAQAQPPQAAPAGYQRRPSPSGYSDWPAAGYPDHPVTGQYSLPAAGHPGQPAAHPDQPAAGYPGQPAAYPDRPAASYPGQPAAYPDQLAAGHPGYSGQPAAYPDQLAAGHPGYAAQRNPDYPGEPAFGDSPAYPDRTALTDNHDDGARHGGHPYRSATDSFAATTSSLDFPSMPPRWGGGDAQGSHDGRPGRHDDSASGSRDNRADGDSAYQLVPPAESFPYGQPPGNPEPPPQRRDTRSSLR